MRSSLSQRSFTASGWVSSQERMGLAVIAMDEQGKQQDERQVDGDGNTHGSAGRFKEFAAEGFVLQVPGQGAGEGLVVIFELVFNERQQDLIAADAGMDVQNDADALLADEREVMEERHRTSAWWAR